jgi:O-antigen ligase
LIEATTATARFRPTLPLWVAGLGGAVALLLGLVAGDPSPDHLLIVGSVLGLAGVGAILARPFAGFLVLAFSVFLLVVIPLGQGRPAANVFDLVMLPVLAVSLSAGLREGAWTGAVGEGGAAHETVPAAARRLSNAVLVYFGLAVSSLLWLGWHLGSGPVLLSGWSILRVVQGALLFPLGLWYLRDERRIATLLRVMLAAGFAFGAVNIVYVFGLGISRAGIVWAPTEGGQAISSSNEGAAALVLLWAVFSARQAARPSRANLALLGLVLFLVPLTQSRSGLLSFAVLLLLSVRHLRWRWILGGLLLAAVLLPLLPGEYWGRLARTLSLKRGSFELFSFMIRVYGYGVAWRTFLDHPLFGVGYLGFRFVSSRYNEIGYFIGTAENFFLETLVGLGVVGLAAVLAIFYRLVQLGRCVRRVAPPGTLAGELARLNGPLVAALLVANLTADNFVGLVAIGQLALWSALLVRSGHLAAAHPAAA